MIEYRENPCFEKNNTKLETFRIFPNLFEKPFFLPRFSLIEHKIPAHCLISLIWWQSCLGSYQGCNNLQFNGTPSIRILWHTTIEIREYRVEQISSLHSRALKIVFRDGRPNQKLTSVVNANKTRAYKLVWKCLDKETCEQTQNHFTFKSMKGRLETVATR